MNLIQDIFVVGEWRDYFYIHTLILGVGGGGGGCTVPTGSFKSRYSILYILNTSERQLTIYIINTTFYILMMVSKAGIYNYKHLCTLVAHRSILIHV